LTLEGIVSDNLNLPNLKTLKHVSSNGQHTYLSQSVEPVGTPCCLLWEAMRFPNGFKSQQFIDTPREGRPAIIHHKRRRWGCEACGKTTYEDLPWAEPGRGITARCADWLFRQAIGRSFTAVSNELGVDARTVAEVFQDHAIPAVKEIRRQTPRVLGLDEKHIFDGFRAVLGNVEQRTMFWMLPARNEETLSRFFDTIPDRHVVEVVTIDMFHGYRRLLPKFFPEAVLVIDKFHITRYATMAIDLARAAMRQEQTKEARIRLMHQRFTLLRRRHKWKDRDPARFEKIKAVYPDLADLFEWKERACDIFDQPYTRDQAERAYIAWRSELPGRHARFFRKFTTAMTNWGREIFNYFDHRYTNAYIERLNGMVDDANRIGRGYSYRVLFLKTMLQHGVPKRRAKKIIRSKDVLDGVIYEFMGDRETIEEMLAPYLDEEALITHGPLLATLSERFRTRHVW
jgi:transposase